MMVVALRSFFTLPPDQAMGGNEQFDVLRVALHRDGEVADARIWSSALRMCFSSS